MGLISRMRNTLSTWRKIVRLSTKPDDEEYMVLVRFALIAILIIGALAYITHLIYVLLVS